MQPRRTRDTAPRRRRPFALSCARLLRGFCGNRALTPILVLEEDLVVAHHAEVAARALLDRLAALLEIPHLGGEARVARLALGVLGLLFRKAVFDLPGAQPAALSEPKRILDEKDQR